uniref:Uncharacterized protein n=1 Tax=Tanacetum cinerariifolium TaxID=118510 RepID=A0A6L2J8U4_TANCI|nr:hypothetical protein [Tanacetum cinerariifolium]
MIRKLQPKSKERRRLECKQPNSKPAIEKSSKLAHALKSKVTKERPSKASTTKPPKMKLAKGKSTKITPPQKAGKAQCEPELEHQGKGDEDDIKLAIQMSLESFQALSEAYVEGVAIQELIATIFTKEPDDTSFNIFLDTPSPTDAETVVASKKTNNGGDTELMQIDEEQGKDVDEQSWMKTRLDQTLEKAVGLLLDHPEPTHDEFITDLYPKVQERLKFLVDEHVILEDLISLTRTLSLMKNLEDAYVVRDQFINGKSTKDEIKKPNMEAKVVFMVTVLVYQASSLVPSLSTLRMFETGTYKSLPKHVALYEALKASMERANRDELLTRNGKVSKETISSQPQAPQSSAWKKSDTRDDTPSSFKQQSGLLHEKFYNSLADDCDAFDSNVDEAPTVQTMLMVNLSPAYPVYGEAGPSYDSDILSKYVKDNDVPVVQSSVSSIQNERYMMILNDMYKQPAQHVSVTTQNNVVNNSLSAEHKMADENVPTPAPTRSDDQILPFVAWVFIGKSNFVLDLHKGKKNLIFHIFVDILHNTNFFKAFTTSASLGYTEVIHFVLRMGVNNLYHLWRAILSMINQCLTGSPTKKGRNDKPHVIPYYQFMKIISCHLGRIHNLHQRSASPFHLTKEDFRLGNLKFIPKFEIDEVFRMPILDELMSNNIKNAPYYNAYLEMVVKHDQKVVAEKYGKKKKRVQATQAKACYLKVKQTSTCTKVKGNQGKTF